MSKNKNKKLPMWRIKLEVAVMAALFICFMSMLTDKVLAESKASMINNNVSDSQLQEARLINSPVIDHIWYLLTVEGGLSITEAYQALKIVECESGFNSMAVNINKNKTIDVGDFVIAAA